MVVLLVKIFFGKYVEVPLRDYFTPLLSTVLTKSGLASFLTLPQPSFLRLSFLPASMCLLLTACNNDSIPLAENQQLSDSQQQSGYCQTHQLPFSYTVCQIDQKYLLEHSDKLALKLFWRVADDNTNKDVKPIYTFEALKKNLSTNQVLLFAMNAGMYNSEFAPIGYTVMDSKQILSLNLNQGAGNFHLMPNGVFWWDDNGFYITESQVMSNMLQSGTTPKYATQSGPMLVINGKIHPQFNINSVSKKIRNGVGVCEKGMVKFVISDVPVNFYNFAQLFQKELQCDNALFLDGGVASALYAPNIQRQDIKKMGVMIGLVENR